MRIPLTLFLAAALSVPIQGNAAEIRDCNSFEANARNLATPFESATQSYANGAISLLNLFLDEPACCGGHLMVLHPAPDDEPFQACTLISRKGSLGYAYIAIEKARATYDPARGLVISLPVGVFDGDMAQPRRLEITVNQGAGTVAAVDK